MAASEIPVIETTETTTTPRPPVSPRTKILQGVGLAVAGVIVLFIGLQLMTDVDATIRAPTVLVALALVFQAIKRIGKAIWGPFWDAGFWLTMFWLLGLIFLAAVADFLPLAEHRDTTKTIALPGNQRPNLLSSNPLGTNNFSLDILARSIYGARVSLLTVTVAVGISMIVGGLIGMFAGYFRGVLETVVGVFTDAILAVPPLILLIALAAVFGIPTEVRQAIINTGIALAVVGIPTMIRLSRANTLVFAQREFVLAAKAMGARHTRIIFRELLPNVLLPVVSYAFIIVAVLIVAEGSLAFLGLGLQQPQPTWGNMIAEGGLTVLRQHPHVPLVPGVFMFLTVFSFNRVGERARQIWDPRESKV